MVIVRNAFEAIVRDIFGRRLRYVLASPRLGVYSKSHDNNFNLIRCVAAVLVILSRSYYLTTTGEAAEPMYNFYNLTLKGLPRELRRLALSGSRQHPDWPVGPDRVRAARGFLNNMAKEAVNGSLWTFPYEVWLYIGLALLWASGMLRSTRRSNVVFPVQ